MRLGAEPHRGRPTAPRGTAPPWKRAPVHRAPLGAAPRSPPVRRPSPGAPAASLRPGRLRNPVTAGPRWHRIHRSAPGCPSSGARPAARVLRRASRDACRGALGNGRGTGCLSLCRSATPAPPARCRACVLRLGITVWPAAAELWLIWPLGGHAEPSPSASMCPKYPRGAGKGRQARTPEPKARAGPQVRPGGQTAPRATPVSPAPVRFVACHGTPGHAPGPGPATGSAGFACVRRAGPRKRAGRPGRGASAHRPRTGGRWPCRSTRCPAQRS